MLKIGKTGTVFSFFVRHCEESSDEANQKNKQ
jgi:hypothetical protein